MIEAYPLQWPVGYKRNSYRIQSRFKQQSIEGVQRSLRNEVSRLTGRNLIISTNLRLRQDGGFYSVDMNKLIDDPGVAVYFKYKNKDVAMCCDKYRTVWENTYALACGIEALRGMDRWGVSDFIDRAFTGFTALPEQSSVRKRDWWEVLEVSQHANDDQIKTAFRRLSQLYHPDKPDTGNRDRFDEVLEAYEKTKFK